MPYTLLQIVNKCLRRLSIVQGDAGELAALSSSQFQTDIDVLVQAINETIDDLYGARGRPQAVGAATIALAEGVREYALAADCERIIGRPPMLIEETSGRVVTEYPGGYEQMVADQPIPATHTGRPAYFAIEPVMGQLRLDRAPTASEAGEVYRYRYFKALSLAEAAATMPFSDRVADNLLPAFCEKYKIARKAPEASPALYAAAMTAAARLLGKVAPATRYGTARGR
ncbi:MAG: hypothetical protein L6R19_27620 [Alphaproteobacteria bacterium]|nr:hypothetical protein [Alphaproteobacteria bacterium]